MFLLTSTSTFTEGVPKGARCIEVRAKGELKSKQPAYNGEVFGKVRYKGSDESVS